MILPTTALTTIMPYRDLTASLELVERLQQENARLRARLGRPPTDWLMIVTPLLLVISVAVIGTVSWWLAASMWS